MNAASSRSRSARLLSRTLSLLSLPLLSSLMTALLLPPIASADEFVAPRAIPPLVDGSNDARWLGQTPSVARSGEGLTMAATRACRARRANVTFLSPSRWPARSRSAYK